MIEIAIVEQGDLHNFWVNLKPSWTKLLPCKDKTWLESVSISRYCLNGCNKLNICALDLITEVPSLRYEILLIPVFPPSPSLTTLLVHVIDILDRDVVLLEGFLNIRKMQLWCLEVVVSVAAV